MKKIILFLTVFLYGDISTILAKINKIENYKPVFKKIKFMDTECKKNKETIIVNNNNTDEVSNLKLMAVFNKKALINNQWVTEGDFIKHFQVIKISPRRVILKNANNIVILKFNNLLKVGK